MSSVSDALPVMVDRSGPDVTVNQVPFSDPTRSSSVSFTVLPAEAVFGLDSIDISLEGSTANLSQATVELTTATFPNPFQATVSGIISDGQFVRASVAAGRFTDAAGNPNNPSTSTDNTITIDNVAPSSTIDQVVDQADPTASLPVRFRVVFSEPVVGFSSSDINFAGSTANMAGRQVTITGTGPTYEVSVTNFSSNGGFVLARVTSNLVTDVLGNSNVDSTSTDNTVTVDNVRPSVTVNQAAGQADPANAGPVRFAVVFNESVTGFEPGDVSFAGSTVDTSAATVVITGSGASYTVEVSNFSGLGNLRISLPNGAALDPLSNTSNASTSTDNQVRIIAPQATLSGRVTNGRGNGVRLVFITVTFPDGSSRIYQTNDFGYFALRNLPTGRVSLRLTRKPTHLLTQTIDLFENTADYNFVFN